MANIEMQLISRVVHSGDLATVLEWGIGIDDFRTVEGKALFNAICAYYADPASRLSVVGPNLFMQRFPQVQLVADNGVATEALCHELRTVRVIAEGKEDHAEFLSDIEVDPDLAISALHTKLTRLLSLGTRKNTDVSLSASLERTMGKYHYAKINGFESFSKMLWPWGPMNELTGGVQEDDYIVFYGRPKSMKTWVMSHMLGEAFRQEKRVLVYTKEMTQDNIFQRASACIMRIPYQEFRTGKLEEHEELSLAELVAVAKTCGHDPICLSGRDADGGDTVSWLHAKIDKYKPDVVFVDGMYLLQATNKKGAMWERVTEISRGLRDMVLATKIPVIATMQANRGAAKHAAGNLDELAYADAIGQDATITIRCIAEKSSPTIALVMAGSREFKLHGMRIHAIPATNFGFKEIMTEKDILTAGETDVDDDSEAEDPAAHSKPRAKKAAKTNGAPPPPPTTSKVEAMVSAQLKSI